jgi:hypothetical protein
MPLTAIHADFYCDRRRLLFFELSGEWIGVCKRISPRYVFFFFVLVKQNKGLCWLVKTGWINGLMQKVCMNELYFNEIYYRSFRFFVCVFEISAFVCYWLHHIVHKHFP